MTVGDLLLTVILPLVGIAYCGHKIVDGWPNHTAAKIEARARKAAAREAIEARNAHIAELECDLGLCKHAVYLEGEPHLKCTQRISITDPRNIVQPVDYRDWVALEQKLGFISKSAISHNFVRCPACGSSVSSNRMKKHLALHR